MFGEQWNTTSSPCAERYKGSYTRALWSKRNEVLNMFDVILEQFLEHTHFHECNNTRHFINFVNFFHYYLKKKKKKNTFVCFCILCSFQLSNYSQQLNNFFFHHYLNCKNVYEFVFVCDFFPQEFKVLWLFFCCLTGWLTDCLVFLIICFHI